MKNNKIDFEKESKEFEKNQKKLRLIFLIIAIPIFLYTYDEIYSIFPNMEWYSYLIYSIIITLTITVILFEISALLLILVPIAIIGYIFHQIYLYFN